MSGPRITTVTVAQVAACPDLQLNPSHYRRNGVCLHVPSKIAVVEEEVHTTCCGGGVQVTRVVHDLISYDPMWFEDGTLTVRYRRVVNSLDSDGYTVVCATCQGPIDVEVDED